MSMFDSINTIVTYIYAFLANINRLGGPLKGDVGDGFCKNERWGGLLKRGLNIHSCVSFVSC